MSFQTRKPKDRSLEVELNLAPFLDIMSVCICFLLTTAVWVTVSGLPVTQTSSKEAGAGQGVSQGVRKRCEMRARYTSPTSLKLVWKEGQRFSVSGQNHAQMLQELHQTLASLKLPAGDSSCALITTSSGVKYGDLIATADTFRQNHFQKIGLTKQASKEVTRELN